MEGGNLKTYIQSEALEPKMICFDSQVKKETILIQKIYHVVSALSYIHSRENGSIIHGDLRPETILTSLGFCKISPVNPTKIDKSTSRVHSYVCPEALAEQSLTIKSDIWNLGLLIYELAFGHSLFKP